MIYIHTPNTVEVKVNGKVIFIDENDFNSIANFRAERIEKNHFFNDGIRYYDKYAVAGEQLVAGSEITTAELRVVCSYSDETLLRRVYGSTFFTLTESDYQDRK
jgi:hypothetical protein